MAKLIKYLLYVIVGLVILAVVIAAYFAMTFNPNDYKQEVIDLVKEQNDRTLKIDGDIKLTYWPKIGADLGKISISEHKSDQLFAAIDNAKVALSVMPLLNKNVVVDTIYIDGAKANIVKYKDGSTNYDDLISKDESSSDSEHIHFNVDGIEISNSAVNYRDEAKNAEYKVSDFNLSSGAIALNKAFDLDTNFKVQANQPAVNASTQIKGNFLFDPETKHFTAKGLDSHITGDLVTAKGADVVASGDVDAKLDTMEILVDGLKLVASANLNGANTHIDVNAPALKVQNDAVSSDKITLAMAQKKGSDDIKLNMTLADLTGSATAVKSAGIAGDINMTQGKRKVAGKFSSPFTGNIKDLIFDIPKLAGNLDIQDPSLPNGKVKGTFNIKAHTEVNNEVANSQFNLVLDDTKLNGDVAVKGFNNKNINFNLNADKLDLNKLLGSKNQKAESKTASNSKPADMSALNTLNLNGKVNIGDIIYDQYRIKGLNVGLQANGKKIALKGLNVKLNDSTIKGALSMSQFKKPLYTFDLDIDQLNLDQYIKQSENSEPANNTGDEPLDLSALKQLNAQGSIRIGKLNYGKTKVSNVKINLKANDGKAIMSPLSANLYQGSMNGQLKVDATSTPSIQFQQNMKSVAVGPMLTDTINNDMLSGTGSVKVNVSTQGGTVNALKKALNGNASLNLANGAVKGIDIAGQIRGIKNKLSSFTGGAVESSADATKKTDFSALTASFNIKNGVAHNEDLAMKAPILRLAKGDSRGDIDIGNQTINYTAKPTVVKSIKGQGGEDLKDLAGIPIPVKISGTFSNPKFGLDFASAAKEVAKSKLLKKVGGEKGAAVQELLEGDNKIDAIKGLLGKKKKSGDSGEKEPAEKPASIEDAAKEGLKDLLKF